MHVHPLPSILNTYVTSITLVSEHLTAFHAFNPVSIAVVKTQFYPYFLDQKLRHGKAKAQIVRGMYSSYIIPIDFIEN